MQIFAPQIRQPEISVVSRYLTVLPSGWRVRNEEVAQTDEAAHQAGQRQRRDAATARPCETRKATTYETAVLRCPAQARWATLPATGDAKRSLCLARRPDAPRERHERWQKTHRPGSAAKQAHERWLRQQDAWFRKSIAEREARDRAADMLCQSIGDIERLAAKLIPAKGATGPRRTDEARRPAKCKAPSGPNLKARSGAERVAIADLVKESEPVGVNAVGEKLYDNSKRGRFRVRMDRKDRPLGDLPASFSSTWR